MIRVNRRLFSIFQSRTSTLSGTPFTVIHKNVKEQDALDGLAKTNYYLTPVGPDKKPMKLLEPISPWHGLELEASTNEPHHVTGVIEIT